MVVKTEEKIGLVAELLCSWAVAAVVVAALAATAEVEEPKPFEAVAGP